MAETRLCGLASEICLARLENLFADSFSHFSLSLGCRRAGLVQRAYPEEFSLILSVING